MDTSDTALLTPRQLASRLGVSEVTLRRWRRAGNGPRPLYLNGYTVRYQADEVDHWLEDSTTRRTDQDNQDT